MSCFGGRDIQLYLLELMIGRIILTPDKVRDVGDDTLAVKIVFIDLPVFEISRSDFLSVKPIPIDKKDGSLEFSVGKSCLFTRQPRDLVPAMQMNPLKIGVFRVGDTFPIAESEVSLSGCLCDQIAMAANDPRHLPKPYSLKGGFPLTDPGGNPSGVVKLDLRLTCFGKFITTQYRPQPRSFFFSNNDDATEFCVKPVIPSGYCADECPEQTTTRDDNALPSAREEDEVSLKATGKIVDKDERTR